MTKKSSKIKFIILAILVAIGVFLSVAKFNIPFTTTTYNGFINAIPLGVDLQGGISAVFDATLPADKQDSDLNTALDATVARIENLLSSKNIIGGTVIKQGRSQIRVEVPDETNADEILKIIGTPASLKITKTEDKDAEAVMTGEHIENVIAAPHPQQSGAYGVYLYFTDEGSDLFADLTGEISESNGTIYIYVGDDDQPLTRLSSPDGAITGGSTFISGDNMKDLESANEFALKILSGSFNTQLSLVQKSTISATLGEKALLFTSISLGVIVLAILVLLPVFFGHFGFLADFAMVVFGIIYLFLLQSVPTVQLTVAGFAGILLSVLLLLVNFVVTYGKISQEYKAGKKLHMSVKSGLNKAISPVADLNAVCAIVSLVLFLFATGSVKSFALIFLLGTLVSTFVSLLVLRRFLLIYLPLNTTKANKLKLKRGADVNEIN